jgi:hypothetical protein
MVTRQCMHKNANWWQAADPHSVWQGAVPGVKGGHSGQIAGK